MSLAFKMTCPVCRRENDLLDAVQEAGAPPPVKGDAAICFGCASVMIFDGEPLGLRLPNDDEDAIYDDPLIALARRGVIEVRMTRGQAS